MRVNELNLKKDVGAVLFSYLNSDFAYSERRGSMQSNREAISSLLEDQILRRKEKRVLPKSDFRSIRKSLQAEVEGSIDALLEEKPDEVTVAGLEEYIEKTGIELQPLANILDKFEGILGRKDLCKVVNFKDKEHPGGKLGDYNYDTREMNLYPFHLLPVELVQTLSHESGHVMNPGRLLPLDEAVEFGVKMTSLIKKKGYSSLYSANAVDVYRKNIKEQVGSISYIGREQFEKSLEDKDLEEEFAEMVSNSLMSELYWVFQPEKYELVESLFERYGMNFDEIKETIQNEVPNLAPEISENLLAVLDGFDDLLESLNLGEEIDKGELEEALKSMGLGKVV